MSVLFGTAQIDIDLEQSMLNRANKGSFAVIKTITTELTLFYSRSKTQKATILTAILSGLTETRK